MGRGALIAAILSVSVSNTAAAHQVVPGHGESRRILVSVPTPMWIQNARCNTYLPASGPS
jgi:hypothetical protein